MKLKVIGYTHYPDDAAEMAWSMGSRSDGYDAVAEDLKANGYVFSGTYHQEGFNGTPVLSDGSLFLVSMRNWGGLMYEVVNGEEDHGAGYCQYAWGMCGEEKHPPEERHLEWEDVVRLFAEKNPERYGKLMRPEQPPTPEKRREFLDKLSGGDSNETETSEAGELPPAP